MLYLILISFLGNCVVRDYGNAQKKLVHIKRKVFAFFFMFSHNLVYLTFINIVWIKIFREYNALHRTRRMDSLIKEG
jgi:hypothetical protein